MSLSAYKKTIKTTETDKDIERRILSRVTGQLERAEQEVADAPAGSPRFTETVKKAIWENQQFWIAVKTDLMLPENQLSDELRASLISLAIWVDRQSSLILAGKGEIQPLIEVNKRLIDGLSGKKD